MDWQPIESAPTEYGFEALVFDGVLMWVASRMGDHKMWMERADGQYIYPTHWMPLPDPPQ